MAKPPSSLEVERFYKGMRIVSQAIESVAKARFDLGALTKRMDALSGRVDAIERRLAKLEGQAGLR